MTKRLVVGLALVCLAAAPAQAELVGYWDFDDNVLDQSPYGNHGTLTNAVYDTDIPPALAYGKSLRFDGDGDYVTIAADPSLNSGVFTLAYFVNQDGATQNGGYERLTSRGGDAFETAVGSNDTLRYWRTSVGWRDTGQTVPDDGWTHVAWVHDGTNMRLYVGGSLVSTNLPLTLSPSGLLRIGARHNGVEGFQGLLDDVALWNTALGPDDIEFIATYGVAHYVPEPATLGLLALGALGLAARRRRSREPERRTRP